MRHSIHGHREIIHFDHDGNKFVELTGWVSKNDGLLIWDRNGNGQIDNGTELFGNNTVLGGGYKADNGFTALAELDANRDSKVDAADAAFANLRVFKDANSNGVADAGELLSLGEAGVRSLNTRYTEQAATDANGNQHLQAGSFTTIDGQSRAMDDVWFSVDTARSIDINADQLWFRRTGNNLEVSILGTADKATVQNWYLGNAYHVEQIKAGDGKLLLDTQVQQLVQAMAAFAPPPMGQTTLTAAQQTALAPVLAANWQ